MSLYNYIKQKLPSGFKEQLITTFVVGILTSAALSTKWTLATVGLALVISIPPPPPSMLSASESALPPVTVNENFPKTTMDLVVDVAGREVAENTQALPMLRQQRHMLTALVIVGGALLGAVVFRLRWENRNEMLLADLPVIQFVDVYSQFRDIDFLRQLDHMMGNDLWTAEATEEVLDSEVERFKMISSD